MTVNINGILSLISAILHQSALFSLFAISTLANNIIKSLNHQGHEYSIEHGYFLSPILCVAMCAFCSLNAIAEKKLGLHLAIITGGICIIIGSLIIFLSSNLYLDFIAVAIYGLGYGLAAMSSTKNACCYFKGHEGLISAIASAGGNLGCTFYNALINWVIIPQNDDGEIVTRVKKYLYLHMILITSKILIVSLIMKKYKNNDGESSNNSEKILSNEKCSDGKNNSIALSEVVPDSSNGDDLTIQTRNIIKKENKENENDGEFKEILFSKRIWYIFAIFFFATFGQNLITTTFPAFGENYVAKNSSDIQKVYISLTFNGFASCIFGALWGFLFDKFGFKVTICLMNALTLLCTSSIYFSKINVYFFCILGVYNASLVPGVYASLFPHLMKVFTHHYSTQSYGIVIIATGISNLIGAFYTFVTGNGAYVYLIVYLTGAMFNIIAFILTLFEGDEKFSFKNSHVLTEEKK